MKLLCHIAASNLAAGVVSNFPDDMQVSEPKDNPGLQGMNLAAWETHRIFYHAVMSTMSAENWPAPAVSLDVPGIISQLPALLGGPAGAALGAAAPLIREILGQIGGAKPAPQPSTPVPPPSA